MAFLFAAGATGWDLPRTSERTGGILVTARNGPFTELVTTPMPLDDDYEYNLDSYWITDQNGRSGQVKVSSPELLPEW